MAILKNDWASILEQEFDKTYYVQLRQFLLGEYRQKTVFPDMYEIFNALHLTTFASTKVVILGQDPYHGPGQAHGLSFSVKPGVDIPPSLQNIFKELQSDLGCFIPNNGCLTPWTQQGVLLLNTVLTVLRGSADSHKGKGWENFTDRIITALNHRERPVVFILWGNNAQKKETLIDSPQHLIIKSPHPSPLSASRGFLGSRPFSRTNSFLKQTGSAAIDWQIPNL